MRWLVNRPVWWSDRLVQYSWLCLLLLFTVLLSPVYAATISVLPDRSPVRAGQEFTLIFSSDQQPDGNPDFSPLDKDFKVLATSTSTNVQVINGVATKEISWRLQMLPKTTGIVKVPAIKFGSDTSPPLNLIVSTDINAGQPDGIIVELESLTPVPYVQQQIIVVQRLMHSVSLDRDGASMSHPRIDEGRGLIQQLGGISNKTLLRDGVRYKVSERRYAVFAQSSGKLTLGRTVFQGILDDGRKRRNMFGIVGRQVRRFSAPLVLDVYAQPPNSGVGWLPAESVSINVHWQVPPERLRTGEPVDLTLAVIADGLLAEQLPELVVKPPQGIKGYANQPEFLNNSEGDTVLATRQDKWILIPTAPGEYTLPEIRLEWWNLKTNQAEVATVPPTKIQVTGEVADNPQDSMEQESLPTAQPEPAVETEMGTEGEDEIISEQLIAASSNDEAIPDSEQRIAPEKPPFPAFWLWLAGFVALALFSLGVWLRRRQKATRRYNAASQARNRVYPLDLLEQACVNDEPQKAYDALSDWVRQDLRLIPATMSQLRKEADFPLKQALDELSMTLYSSQHDHWEGEDLWQAVNQHLQPQQRAEREHSGLLSLYPD